MMASKRVSIDEYLGSRGFGGVERKSFARDNGVILKGVRDISDKAKYDKEKGQIRFTMSAEVEDRDRDIVVQAGLDTAEFEKNPVAPWAHRSGNTPIGQWSELSKNLTGRPKRTEGLLTLTLGDPQADIVALHLEAGSIRACSIGFMPLAIERREVPEDKKDSYFYPGYIIHEAELYECSPCSVPANPAALAKAAAAGDAMSRELIEQVLDTWDLKDGLLVPRKAFENAHRNGSGAKTGVVVTEEMVATLKAVGVVAVGIDEFNGRASAEKFHGGPVEPFFVRMKDGKPNLTSITPVPPEPTDAERLVESLKKDSPEGKSLLAWLGKFFAPAPAIEIKQPVVDEITTLAMKHDLLEADAALAALDDEMGRHVPA